VIYRTYLGLDLQPQALRAVALRRQGKLTTLAGGRLLGLDEGVLVPSFRSPNIKDIERFIDGLTEVLDPLAAKEDRLSLALPEQAGIQMLVDIEAPMKSKAEGIEVLKWQLRDKLPEDVALQLDYQVLHRDENGRQKLLVVCMSADVLVQYEEVLNQAGYGAEVIGFRSMGLLNYYRSRLDLGDNFVLIHVEDANMTFQYFQNQMLSFHRSRIVDGEIENVFREINRSLAGEQDRFSGINRAPVFIHSNWDIKEDLPAALSSLFSLEPVLLKPSMEKLTSEPLALTEKQTLSLVTAIGSAERLM